MHFLPQGELKKSSVLTIWVIIITSMVALGIIIVEYGNYSVLIPLGKFDEKFVTASILSTSITALSVVSVFVGQFLVLINFQKLRWALLSLTALILFLDVIFLYQVLSAQSAVAFEPTFPNERGYVLQSPKFGVMMQFFYWHLIGFVVFPIAYKAFNGLYRMVKSDFFSTNKSAQ